MSVQRLALVVSLVLVGTLAGAMVCRHAADEASAQTAASVSAELDILYMLGSDRMWQRYVLDRPDITTISDLAHLMSILTLVTKEEGATWTFDILR